MNYWSFKRDQFAQPFWKAVKQDKRIVKHACLWLCHPISRMELEWNNCFRALKCLQEDDHFKALYNSEKLVGRLIIRRLPIQITVQVIVWCYAIIGKHCALNLGSDSLGREMGSNTEWVRLSVCVHVCVNGNSLEIKCEMWEKREVKDVFKISNKKRNWQWNMFELGGWNFSLDMFNLKYLVTKCCMLNCACPPPNPQRYAHVLNLVPLNMTFAGMLEIILYYDGPFLESILIRRGEKT